MNILRVFNNNVVLARGDDGQEVIVTGRGLGFGAKPGDRLDDAKVVRRFIPDEGRNADNFGRMLASIPPEHLAVVDKALEPIRAEAGAIPSSTIVAIADHVSFAIKRVRQHIEVEYPLRAEIVHLYPRELDWAERIVASVNAQQETQLLPDEAVPIALHLVNASFNSGNLADTYQMTGVFTQIFDVIEGAYGQPLDRGSINVARFITHLRYFFVRVHSHAQLEDDRTVSFTSTIRDAYPDAYKCALRVRDILELRLGEPVTEDEVTYLTMHIARLTNDR